MTPDTDDSAPKNAPTPPELNISLRREENQVNISVQCHENENPAADPISDFFARLVDNEQQRKNSLEQRGMSLLAASGTLATVLFAFAGLLAHNGEISFGPGEKTLLVVVLILFVAAGFCGLVVNGPRASLGVDIVDLSNAYLHDTERFFGKASAVQRSIAQYFLGQVDSAQKANKSKANWLGAGCFLLVVALMALASLVGWVY
jgi:hypothetical protein